MSSSPTRYRAVGDVHVDLELSAQEGHKVVEVGRAEPRLLGALRVVGDAREQVQLAQRLLEAPPVPRSGTAVEAVALEVVLRVPVERRGRAAKVEDRRVHGGAQPARRKGLVEDVAHERRLTESRTGEAVTPSRCAVLLERLEADEGLEGRVNGC